MNASSDSRAQNRWMAIVGWVLTALIALLLTFSAVMKFIRPDEVVRSFVNRFGYPEDFLLVLGVVEVACLVIYLIPQTAILGAIVLTGYLGGAVATHVRIYDNFAGAVVVGVVVWLAVYLREPRLRALLPLRRPSSK